MIKQENSTNKTIQQFKKFRKIYKNFILKRTYKCSSNYYKSKKYDILIMKILAITNLVSIKKSNKIKLYKVALDVLCTYIKKIDKELVHYS